MEELDPIIAPYLYDENGELNDYARSMQQEFPEIGLEHFAAIRFGMENEVPALLGRAENHFGAFEYSRLETAVEKHMALAADGSNPVPLQLPSSKDELDMPIVPEVDLEALQRESNTERFASKAADVAAAIPSQLLGATVDFGKDVITQPIRTVVGSVENAERMASGVINTGKDAPDVVDYAFKRLDQGVGNMISRGIGLVGNEGDARTKGWNRIFAVQRAIDAIPGPALMMAGTTVRLPIQTEADLEYYKSLGINPRNAKVGGHMDRYINITKLDQIAERFGTTAAEMTITGGESAVAKSYSEVDTALGAFIGDATAFAAMTVATGGGNVLVRAAKDGAIEAGSYTDVDPGFSEAILHMVGFDEDEIPELLKTSGKQDLPAMAVRFAEGAAFSLAAETLMGTFGKLKRGEITDQAVLKKTVEETHTVVKEAISEMEETAQALAKEADAHVNAAKAIEAEDAIPTGPAAANPDVDIPEFPKNLSGASPKYRNMALEFDNETAKALYIVGGNGKSAHHDAFMDFLNKTLGTETDWAAVGTRMRDAMKENYVEGGTFKVELPYEARFDVAKSAMAKDAMNNAPTPKSIEISSNMEGIVEDLAVGKHLDDLDDKAIDAATGVRDFRNYPFLETVGKTTDAIKRNLESALEKQPTTVKAIIGKADAALQQLRKEFGDGHLPAWALEKIDTGSQAADVLARVISIKTTNDQIVRLTEYINVLNKGTNPDAALKNLGGLQFISKAENPREMATWYLTKLLEGAEDLNGAYNKIARDWGQTGVILNKLKRGIQDADTQANLEQVVKREMEAGYLTPEEAVKRMEDYKLANANKLNKFGDGAQKHGLIEFLEKNQYGSLLVNTSTMAVNLFSEAKRTVGLATVAPIANSIALFRQGQVGKAGIEAGRLLGQVFLAPLQVNKVIRNVHDVWATGMGNMTRELTPYMKSQKAQTLGDVFNAHNNIPLGLANVTAAVAIRTMGTISEAIGTIFHGANTDYSTLVGQFGKKWQQRLVKQGGLSPSEITEMLTEQLPKSQQRATVNGNIIDGELAGLSDAARFQDNIIGTAVGNLERAYNKQATKWTWMNWAIPFFGVGVRIAEETATMAIPGLAYLNKGGMSTVAAKRMGLGQFAGPVPTYSQRAWRYYYGAMQVNMMTSMLQGLNDYSELVDGMPPLPTEMGEKTEHFKPVSGKFGQFGGGIVEYEMTPEGVRRVEEKSFEMMNSDTISFLWRNLGWHLALIGDDTDATEAGEAMSRMLQSQINSVFGTSVARTLPAEFARVTGAEGGKGYFDWVLGKVGGQIPLGSGYRNMKKLYKEYFSDPETYKATFEDGWGAYSAGRLSWLGDFATVAWPGQFRAMNLNLGFAGYPVDASKRGNIDPSKKVATLPKSVIVANWVAEQQDRKLVREEWTVPGSNVLLRDVMGPSGFSLFTETMKASQTTKLPHPLTGEMLTITEYMDGELENPISQLSKDLGSRGLAADKIVEAAEASNKDPDKAVAALEGGEVLWEFIKATQKRYNDMALADIINNAPKATREAILEQIEMQDPMYWYAKFPPEVKAQLNLIDKGEATYSDGEFRLYEEGQ